MKTDETFEKIYNLLFLGFLPFRDDEEQTMEQFEGRADVVDLSEVGDRIFIKRLLVVDPLDLLQHVRQSLLDVPYVVHVLAHLIQLDVIVEFIGSLLQLLKFKEHLLTLGN